MNTNTSLKYLAVAVAKACEPMHPNFRSALDQRIVRATTPSAKAKARENKLRLEGIRLATARAFDATGGDPRKTIVATLRALKDDMQAHVTFTKGLARDCAFVAHLDCAKYERATNQVEPELLDQGVDAMAEEHGIDTDDIPAFDMADIARLPGRDADGNLDPETAEGADAQPDEAIATSIEDAYEAIISVQAWLSLAYAGVKLEQQEFWGVDGLFPFDQRRVELPSGETTFEPIRDFNEYREYQRQQWKEKSRRVAIDPDTENQMLAS